MTKNIQIATERKLMTLMEREKKLRREREALIAICTVLATVLGTILILI